MWPFKRRDLAVTLRLKALDEQARSGSNTLMEKVAELHSRRELLMSLNHIDSLSEEALRELHGARRG